MISLSLEVAAESANDDETGAASVVAAAAAVVGALVDGACLAGAASTFNCCALPELATAMLSPSGASAALAIGKSIFDFRFAPCVIALDIKIISRKFIVFDGIMFISNVFRCTVRGRLAPAAPRVECLQRERREAER